MTETEFLALCTLFGYRAPTVLPDGRYAAVCRRPYNTQVLVGIDPTGYQTAY